MYSYYVKAPGGSYCRWNQANQQFDPLGITQFEGSGGLEEYLNRASSAEKSAIVFTTSLNGAIAHIPAGYTVEVRDLIVGTKYKVDEPDREIPKGYTRRDSDGYVRTDLDDGPMSIIPMKKERMGGIRRRATGSRRNLSVIPLPTKPNRPKSRSGTRKAGD